MPQDKSYPGKSYRVKRRHMPLGQVALHSASHGERLAHFPVARPGIGAQAGEPLRHVRDREAVRRHARRELVPGERHRDGRARRARASSTPRRWWRRGGCAGSRCRSAPARGLGHVRGEALGLAARQRLRDGAREGAGLVPAGVGIDGRDDVEPLAAAGLHEALEPRASSMRRTSRARLDHPRPRHAGPGIEIQHDAVGPLEIARWSSSTCGSRGCPSARR